MAGDREQSHLPVASLIAIVLALGGLWLYQSPLKSSRPDHASTRHTDTPQARVPARLWQDPFAAIEQHRARVAQMRDNESLKTLEQSQQLRPGYFGIDEATVLLIMLDSGPYAEDVEQRLRTRYTVGMALNSAGWVQQDSLGIRYFTLHASQTFVPFELYQEVRNEEEVVKKNKDNSQGQEGREKNQSPSTKNLLILWVPDSTLGAVQHIVQRVRSVLPKSAFTLVGPRNSTTLMAMIQDASCARDRDFNDLEGLKVFSYRSTADPEVFRINSGVLAQKDCEMDQNLPMPEAVLGSKKITLIRTVGSDVSLANELLDELLRRGVKGLDAASKYDPEECQSPSKIDKIALVTEADTFYGRVLPLTFAASLLVKTGNEPNLQKALQGLHTHSKSWPCSMATYSYLNGLDGEVPLGGSNKQTNGEQSRGPRPEQASSTNQSTQKRPEGPSQLDYVVRLATKIKADNDANHQNGLPTFRAIGILGSDVYDKLLLLQALRQRLPNAIFFTTDLDARLLHEEEFPWTRNLIIASHYDLRLSEAWNTELNVRVAPFRDSYQTSLYLSTLQAVGWLQDRHQNNCLVPGDSEKPFARNIFPKLYEVGRRGAVDISVNARLACEKPEVLPVSPDRPSIVPKSMTIFQHRFGFFSLVVTLMSAFGLLLILMVRPLWTAADEVRSWLMKRWWNGAIGIAIFLGACWLVLWFRTWLVSDGNAGEPFSLFDSVSIWPTEVLRLIGIGLALGFFAKGAWDLHHNRVSIEKRFLAPDRLSTRQASLTPDAPNVGWLKGWRWAERWIHTRSTPSTEQTIDAATLWHAYVSSGRFAYAAPRILLMLLAYFIFAFVLFNQFEEPLRPCRGLVSCVVDSWLLVLSVMSAVLLNIWVFDVVRRCVALIEHVTAGPTQWPSDVLNTFLSERNVPKAYLPDWLDIQFIAERTKTVGGLVVYPFIVFVVVFAARNRYFDDWDFPIPLVIVFSLNAFLILGTAMLLKKSAERARATAWGNMNTLLIALKGCQETSSSSAAQLQLLMDEVKNTRRGAFNNIFQQPAVTASLLGALALLQYFLPI